jgi:hypothetical protein
MTWEKYLDGLKIHPSFDARLNLLADFKKVLIEKDFHEIDEQMRKRIAGTTGRDDTEEYGYDSRWFGGMSGAGMFAHKVIANPEGITKALQHIPKTGQVSLSDYIKFINEMKSASGYDQNPLSVSTRLLAMLRPDYFFCVTSANINYLAKDLNFPKSLLDTGNYWSLVVEPLINSEWWNIERPSETKEQKIWDSRVALLDILYYEKK